VNRILDKHQIPLQLDLPRLLRTGSDTVIVDVPDANASATSVSIFQRGEKIGAGGYGTVFRATRSTEVSQFEFAVKILDPSPFVTDYEKALRRFQREIKAMQLLQHRGIVYHYEAGLTTDRKPYLVMPYIEGANLRSGLSGRELRVIVDAFIEIVGALRYAHERNVLHRDLKPSNIILRHSDQQPIILDFGAAYLLDFLDSDSLTSQVVGTIGYIPSEVLANPKLRTPLQDVYACGVMLYECIASRMPDPSDYEPLSRIDEAYSSIDNIVQNAIAGASKRTRSAALLLEELKAVREELLTMDIDPANALRKE
jgi:serine/threonine protein kinase